MCVCVCVCVCVCGPFPHRLCSQRLFFSNFQAAAGAPLPDVMVRDLRAQSGALDAAALRAWAPRAPPELRSRIFEFFDEKMPEGDFFLYRFVSS